MQDKIKLVGIYGKTENPVLAILSKSIANVTNTTVSDDLSVLSRADIIFVPTLFPFIETSVINKIKNINVPVVTVVLDTLALEPFKELMFISDKVMCFSRDVRNILLSLNINSSKILVNSFSELIQNDSHKSAVSNNKIEINIPARRLKQVHVDSIISLIYKLKSNSINFKFRFYGTKNEVNSGFSKYLTESISNKGFSKDVEFINEEYAGNSTADVRHYTLLLNSNEQNQSETLVITCLSLASKSPVILDAELPQATLDMGVAYAKPNYSTDFVNTIYSIITSENLYVSLTKEVNECQRSFDLSNMPLKVQTVNIFSSSKSPAIISLSSSIPKVLLQNRSNAFTQPGGDTVLMQKIIDLHSKDMYDVEVCVDGSKDPENYDLVHLFNFAIKEVTEAQAKEAVAKSKPFNVTTLYEDWPKFFNQMATFYLAAKAYVEHGQPISNWSKYEELAKNVEPCAFWDNSFAANNAKVLYSSGKQEERSLRRDYPYSKEIINVKFGCEVSEFFDGGELFRRNYGISDFVLCVGRLEWRKNQLMLLKALEDVDVPIVFAASHFTYQPEYEAVCKAFKRKGKTLFLSRLTEQELASAYQAAAVHALPSWYELPGLVSIEAARYGTPVVATEFGTISDYLGEQAHYCEPGHSASVKTAVINALNKGKSDNLKKIASQYTWENAVKQYEEGYSFALNGSYPENNTDVVNNANSSNSSEKIIELTSEVVEDQIYLNKHESDNIIDYCSKGDELFKTGNFLEAKNAYEQSITCSDKPGRAYRSLGALSLYLKEFNEANNFFKLALENDPFDGKALLGKGAVLWEEGKKREAFSLYKQASDLNPTDPSAILYLVNSAYELEALPELEICLRRYLRQEPNNINIQYCLAGCYFKQEKYSAALGVLERLFTIDQNHADGRELKDIIEKKINIPLHQEVEVINTASVNNNKSIEANYKLAGSKELAELEELKATRQYKEVITKADQYLANPNYCDTALDHFDIIKAESLGCIGDVEKAKDILLELKSRDVQPARVMCDLGAIELSKQNVQLATNMFEEALSHDSQNDTAFAGLAMCAQVEGRLEDAWTLFEESLRKNPQNIQAIYGLVQLGYEFKRLDKVERFLREYLELKPIDISILYSLAGCLYAQGKSTEAVGELKNILLFDPENESAIELIDKINTENNSASTIS